MFEGGNLSIDALEQVLLDRERLIAQARAQQAELLAVLDAAAVTQLDGARSLVDWAAARLDVSQDTARGLVHASNWLPEYPQISESLADGDVSFDRALATMRLADSGAAESLVDASAGFDIAGVRRLAARQRRVTKISEETAYRDRYVAMQPTLGEGSYRLWGLLPGFEGRLLEKALQQRADELPPDPDGSGSGRRLADALVSIAQDSLAGRSGGDANAPVVSVFVDAELVAATVGEAGAEIASGPRIGPATLERLLCDSRVQVVAHDGLKPVAASPATRVIPPAIRRFVLWRDGGCVIDGCHSRYRLQPHHIVPFSAGGDHDTSNLASVCWYHHHTAIHGSGFRLDPDSPPQRRRLLAPKRGPDPP